LYGTDAADSVAVKPAKDAAGGAKWFDDGPPGTVVDHDVMNMFLDELQTIVTQIGGIALDKTNDNQIYPILWHVRGIRSTTADDTGLTTPDLRAVVASTTCDVGGDNSAVVASINSDCVTAGGASERLVAACQLGTIANNSSTSAVIASTSGAVSGAIGGALVAACLSSTASGNNAVALGSSAGTASGSQASTISSLRVQSTGDRTSVLASYGASGTGVDVVNAGTVSAIVASNGNAVSAVTIAAGAAQAAIVASSGTSANPVSVANGATEALIAACDDVAIGATSNRCAVIACEGTDTTAADRSAAVASNDVTLTQCTESAVVASENVTINTTNGAILIGGCDFSGAAATIGGTTNCSAIIASEDDGTDPPDVTGQSSSVISSMGHVEVTGDRATAIACETGGAGAGTGPLVVGDKSAAVCSDGRFTVTSNNCMMVCSSLANQALNLNADANSMIFGEAGVAGGTARTIKLLAPGGLGTSDGGFTGAGIDYAEYFENAESGALPVGSVVSHAGGKVQLAQPGDRVLGIVSAAPAFVGGDAELHWHGIWKRDEWGRRIETDVPMVRWEAFGDGDDKQAAYEGPLADAPIKPPEDASRWTQSMPITASGYDAARADDYAPRRQRPDEWTCVGLMGQLRVRVDNTVKEGSFVVPGKDGIGTHADEPPRTGRPIECFRVTAKATKKRGCAVALCLVG
jgi:hypothetical protein